MIPSKLDSLLFQTDYQVTRWRHQLESDGTFSTAPGATKTRQSEARVVSTKGPPTVTTVMALGSCTVWTNPVVVFMMVTYAHFASILLSLMIISDSYCLGGLSVHRLSQRTDGTAGWRGHEEDRSGFRCSKTPLEATEEWVTWCSQGHGRWIDMTVEVLSLGKEVMIITTISAHPPFPSCVYNIIDKYK